MIRLLIVSDDLKQAENFQQKFGTHFAITRKDNSLSTFDYIATNSFDAILVKAKMPNIDGFEFVKKVRFLFENNPPELFMICHDTSEKERIKALHLKVKDLLSFNYSDEEIILRIENHIQQDNSFLNLGDLIIDPSLSKVTFKNKKLNLTFIEFKLLHYLATNRDQVVPRVKLIGHVWGEEKVLDKTINSHLSNLRAKLNGTFVQIHSEKGLGVVLTLSKK